LKSPTATDCGNGFVEGLLELTNRIPLAGVLEFTSWLKPETQISTVETKAANPICTTELRFITSPHNE